VIFFLKKGLAPGIQEPLQATGDQPKSTARPPKWHVVSACWFAMNYFGRIFLRFQAFITVSHLFGVEPTDSPKCVIHVLVIPPHSVSDRLVLHPSILSSVWPCGVSVCVDELVHLSGCLSVSQLVSLPADLSA